MEQKKETEARTRTLSDSITADRGVLFAVSGIIRTRGGNMETESYGAVQEHTWRFEYSDIDFSAETIYIRIQLERGFSLKPKLKSINTGNET